MRGIILLIFIGLLLLPFRALTQPIFSPGEVVLNSGDTLRGFVAELGEKKRYDRCLFKRKLEGEKIIYGPDQLRSFRITDRYYFESRSLGLPTGDTSQVFMLLALKGELQVLKYKSRIFLETTTGRRQEAPTQQNQKADSRAEKYQAGQLKFQWYQFLSRLKENCPALQSWYEDQEKANYKLEELIEIAKTYHDCQGQSFEVIGQDIPLFEIDCGVSFGAAFSRLTFSGPHKLELSFMSETILHTSGIELYIPIIFKPQRYPTYFSVYLTPVVGSYNYYGELAIEQNRDPNLIYYDVQQSWINAGLMAGLRYTVPRIEPQIILQTGMRREYFFRQKFSTIEERIYERSPGAATLRKELRFPFKYFTGQTGWTTQLTIQDHIGSLDTQWALGLGYSLNWAFLTTNEVRENINRDFNTLSHMSTFFTKATLLW